MAHAAAARASRKVGRAEPKSRDLRFEREHRRQERERQWRWCNLLAHLRAGCCHHLLPARRLVASMRGGGGQQCCSTDDDSTVGSQTSHFLSCSLWLSQASKQAATCLLVGGRNGRRGGRASNKLPAGCCCGPNARSLARPSARSHANTVRPNRKTKQGRTILGKPVAAVAASWLLLGEPFNRQPIRRRLLSQRVQSTRPKLASSARFVREKEDPSGAGYFGRSNRRIVRVLLLPPAPSQLNVNKPD